MIFALDKEEIIKFERWNSRHKKSCKLYMNDGTIGGRLTFSFTPTGLGIITKVRCSCGAEVNLTDVSKW